MGIRRMAGAAAAACLLVLTVGGTSSASAAGAHKAPLERGRFNNCFTGQGNEGPTGYGFVIGHQVGGTVSTQVVLHNVEPNHTYTVYVTLSPSGFGCNVADATITTNAQGNGTLHLREPAQPGTTGVFVLVFDGDFTGPFFQTANIPLD